MGNGRILGEIAASENHKPTDFTIDTERFFPAKVFRSPFRTEPPQLIERILTTSRRVQGLFINIGGIDFYVVILDPRSKCSASSMAIEYASSPLAQPALHARKECPGLI